MIIIVNWAIICTVDSVVSAKFIGDSVNETSKIAPAVLPTKALETTPSVSQRRSKCASHYLKFLEDYIKK